MSNSSARTRATSCVTLGAIGALGIAGCDHHVFSPPARALPLETSATLPRGDTGIQITGATHGALTPFGGGLRAESGTLSVRYGVDESTDVSVEASALHVDGDSAAGTWPYAFGGRFGAKRRLAPGASVTAGLGGGGSAAGGFISPDVGVVAAFENPYVVPFVGARFTASLPFARHAVDTAEAGATATYVSSPLATWMGGMIAGLRIQLSSSGRPVRGELRGALVGGFGLTLLADAHEDVFVGSAAGGFEVVF